MNELKTQESQVNAWSGQFKHVLKDPAEADAFALQLVLSLKKNDKLAQAVNNFAVARAQFFSHAIVIALAGLSPDPERGHVAMIPFNSKNDGMRVSLIIMYQGYCIIARKNGIAIIAHTVKSDDDFSLDLANMQIRHQVNTGIRSPDSKPTGYYAIATETKSNQRLGIEYMSSQEMHEHYEKHVKTKQNSNSKFWSEHPQAMARKTVILQLMKTIGVTFFTPLFQAEKAVEEPRIDVLDLNVQDNTEFKTNPSTEKLAEKETQKSTEDPEIEMF